MKNKFTKITADAQQYVGNGRATAYWDARG